MEVAHIATIQEITNEGSAHHFLRYKGVVHFEFIPAHSTKLIIWKY